MDRELLIWYLDFIIDRLSRKRESGLSDNTLFIISAPPPKERKIIVYLVRQGILTPLKKTCQCVLYSVNEHAAHALLATATQERNTYDC